jgi:hypothetical protein
VRITDHTACASGAIRVAQLQRRGKDHPEASFRPSLAATATCSTVTMPPNPAAIARQIADLQKPLLKLAKDQTEEIGWPPHDSLPKTGRAPVVPPVNIR